MFACTQNYRTDLMCPRSRSSRAMEILCFILSPVMPSLTLKWKLQMPCLKRKSYTRTSRCQVLSKWTLTRIYIYRQGKNLPRGFLPLATCDKGKSVENVPIPGRQYPCPRIKISSVVICLVLFLNHGVHGQRMTHISWHKRFLAVFNEDWSWISFSLSPVLTNYL